MNPMTYNECETVSGGMQDSPLTVWGAKAAEDGLGWATKSGGNVLVMTEGTLLAAAGGWVWAFGSAWDGLASLFR